MAGRLSSSRAATVTASPPRSRSGPRAGAPSSSTCVRPARPRPGHVQAPPPRSAELAVHTPRGRPAAGEQPLPRRLLRLFQKAGLTG